MKTPHRSGALASRRGLPLSYGCEARNWLALYQSSIKACKSIGFRFAARRAIVSVPGTWQPVRKAPKFCFIKRGSTDRPPVRLDLHSRKAMKGTPSTCLSLMQGKGRGYVKNKRREGG
jgi:hypothetical protein